MLTVSCHGLEPVEVQQDVGAGRNEARLERRLLGVLVESVEMLELIPQARHAGTLPDPRASRQPSAPACRHSFSIGAYRSTRCL